MIKRIFFFFGALCLSPYVLCAISSSPIHSDTYSMTRQYTSQAIALGKTIEKNAESPILDRVIYQREAIGNALQKLYAEFDY